MDLNKITYEIIGAAMKVHSKLGPGLLESVYEACLTYELRKRGFEVVRQTPVPLIYDEVTVSCGFQADMIVDGVVLVELKAKEQFHPIDHAQALSHVRLLDFEVGLMINFHVVNLKDGIRRLVNNFVPSSDA